MVCKNLLSHTWLEQLCSSSEKVGAPSPCDDADVGPHKQASSCADRENVSGLGHCQYHDAVARAKVGQALRPSMPRTCMLCSLSCSPSLGFQSLDSFCSVVRSSSHLNLRKRSSMARTSGCVGLRSDSARRLEGLDLYRLATSTSATLAPLSHCTACCHFMSMNLGASAPSTLGTCLRFSWFPRRRRSCFWCACHMSASSAQKSLTMLNTRAPLTTWPPRARKWATQSGST